jgi:multiple sugar transport system permease protein
MKKKAKGKSIYKKQDNIAGYVMLAPWMFGFLLMWFIPMLISIYYSFTNFNLLNDAKVIGFDNYIRIFTQDETFRQALKVTFIYVLFLVPLRLARSQTSSAPSSRSAPACFLALSARRLRR